MKLLALTLVAAVATAASASARPAAHQTLLLDALSTHVRSGGGPANTVGHLDVAGGPLRDVHGRRAVGHFAFTCRTTAILGGGDAREHCAGWGQTADGRIGFAGPTRRSDATHEWTISARSGAYRGARGTIVARDLGDRESLLTITITPRAGVVLHSGVLERPAADRAFRRRADLLCASAARQLAALPPFPFSPFDPLHPDPALLPAVGRFFTGPGDSRPTLRTLGARLSGLGPPPADADTWRRVLSARAAALAVEEEQDRSALAADAPAFIKTVRDAERTFRSVAIASTVFGVSRCVI